MIAQEGGSPRNRGNFKSQTNFPNQLPTGWELIWEFVWDLEVGSALELGIW